MHIHLPYDALIVFDAAQTTLGGSARLMARKGLQLCNVEFVTLIVGAARAIYHVHLNLLCNASSVFKAEFTTGRFEEGNRRSMDLIDDDVDAVDRLVQWLYSKTYTISPFDTEEHANERFHQLARLNTFADKYQIYALSQNILSRMGEPHMESWRIPPFPPRMSVVAYVYDNTNEISDFRKMMVEWYTWGIPMRWYDNKETRDDLLGVSKDFSVDLAIALGQKSAFSGRQGPSRLKQMYHEDLQSQAIDSDDDEECRGDK